MENKKIYIAPNQDDNSKNCKVKTVVNISGFAACETTGVLHCAYVVNFGFSKYCFHPEWKSFIGEERK